MASKTKVLTSGSPYKVILSFAIPTLAGLLFQQLYNMVDTMIVGKWLGVQSLAAVGSVGSLNFMIIGFCTGVCAGFSIPIAQQLGAGDFEKLRKFFANSIWLSAIFSLVTTAAVCVLCRNMLELMKTPDDIIDEAYTYIFIIFLGIPMTYLYNLLSGVIRALGDSKTPVIFILISSVINIVFDILSISVFKMGVAGPAIATVFSQAVSGVLCLVHIIRRFDVLHPNKDEAKFRLSYITQLLSAGLPMGLQYSITAIGSVVLQSSVNVLGSNAVAAVTAGSKINTIFACPLDALGTTMATFAGQNIGAGKPERIKKGLKTAIGMGCVYSVFVFAVILLFGKYIALLFMNSNETQILSQVSQFSTICTAFYCTLSILNCTRFTVQGMGHSAVAMFAGVFEMVARCVMGFILVPMFGYVCVCFASPLAWVMADLFLLPTFAYCIKKKPKHCEEAESKKEALNIKDRKKSVEKALA